MPFYRPLKEKIFISLVVAGSILVAFILSEYVLDRMSLVPKVYRLQSSDKKTAYVLSQDPLLGYELQPNFKSSEPNCHNTFHYINSHGFRDSERSYGKKKGKKRIIILGDSIVVGHGICDESKTISKQLETLMGEDYEVLNMAYGGYNTSGEVELLFKKGLKYNPDYVILIFFVNDFSPYNSQVEDSSCRFNRPQWAERLFVKSNVFRLLSIKFDLYNFRQLVDSDYAINRHKDKLKHITVEHSLARLRQMSQDHDFHSSVVLWPMFHADGLNYDLHPKAAGDKLLIEEITKNVGLPFYRLDQFFIDDYKKRRDAKNKKSQNWIQLYTIGDAAHPSAVGAEVAALAIRKLLNQSLGI